MVGVKGLGGLPEPKANRPARVRDAKAKEPQKTEKSQDGLVISNAAQAAATVTRSIKADLGQQDVRADKVAAAREHLARGDYKRPDIVAQVAERISKYLP